MRIVVRPNQIPKVWELIKFATYKIYKFSDKEMTAHLNSLLIRLLSGKSYCIVRIDDTRQITLIMVGRVDKSDITEEKSLHVDVLYSFKPISDDEWRRVFDTVMELAAKINCNVVFGYSTNDRMTEILTSLDFKQQYRCFALRRA